MTTEVERLKKQLKKVRALLRAEKEWSCACNDAWHNTRNEYRAYRQAMELVFRGGKK